MRLLPQLAEREEEDPREHADPPQEETAEEAVDDRGGVAQLALLVQVLFPAPGMEVHVSPTQAR